ncbi:MAG: hypothetical protein WC667_09630 [Sulfurimonas sp.]|jgi:hypothetical protein
MTNESLEQYIQMYNSGKWNIPISSYRIGENVVFGKVWSNYPTGEVSNEESKKFYFIEHAFECVAIVFEMDKYDLHWLVTERMRKKGYLHNALKEIILPHMFSDGRLEQCASADSEKNIKYLLRQGFEERNKDGKIIYFLNSNNVKLFTNSQVKRTQISDNEFANIKKQLHKLASELRIIRDQIKCAYDDDFNIEDIAYQVDDLGYEIEYQCKNS